MKANETPDLTDLLPSWERHLRAVNLSPRTVQSYLEAADRLLGFLRANGRSTTALRITRDDLEAFVGDVIARHSPATAGNRYRSLRQLFKWLAEEDEIDGSPMDGMRGPKVPEQPVPILTTDELQRLLKVCAGRGFDQRRDSALLLCFIDTGARLSEIVYLRVDDVDLDVGTLRVMGNGRRERVLPVGRAAVRALDRYRRERVNHELAYTESQWLGSRGAMTPSGVTQLLRRRAKQANVAGLHPHRFRHTFAHQWLASGGGETDLQRIAGWRDPQMLRWYGASAAEERARAANTEPR